MHSGVKSKARLVRFAVHINLLASVYETVVFLFASGGVDRKRYAAAVCLAKEMLRIDTLGALTSVFAKCVVVNTGEIIFSVLSAYYLLRREKRDMRYLPPLLPPTTGQNTETFRAAPERSVQLVMGAFAFEFGRLSPHSPQTTSPFAYRSSSLPCFFTSAISSLVD
jgi:hypothetical protein